MIVWNVHTKYIFPEEYSVGDLSRMSYLDSNSDKKHTIVTLEKQHIEFVDWKGENIDILTVGDSFSQGAAGGLNPFYQDYIATHLNKNVLNIHSDSQDYIEFLYVLINSGMLEQISPKVVMIESTEREVINRFDKRINDNVFIDYKILKQKLQSSVFINRIEEEQRFFINNININAFLYNILYRFDDNAYFSSCYLTDLSKKVFSVGDGKTLMFYKDYIKYNDKLNVDSIQVINDNFNKLAQKLQEMDIELYFMPVVDKFNLYSKYVLDNKYGNRMFFEELRKMKRDYKLIDTKAVLEQEVENNVLDIFYMDDTHWSYKASEAIVNCLK
jgi:hypothetical protein